GTVCDHLDRVAGLRAGDAALRAVPDDRLFDRGGAAALCSKGHRHHAGADVAGAGRADHLARGLAVPAAVDRTADAEITQRFRAKWNPVRVKKTRRKGAYS